MKPLVFHARHWLLSVGLGYIEIAISGIVFLIMTPLLVSRLGAEGYAVWVLGHAIAAYLRMLDLGLGDTHVRFFSRYAGARRTASMRNLTATITVVLGLAGLAALAAGALIAFGPREWWDEIAASQQWDMRAVILLLAFQVFALIPGAALDDVYEGLQRMDLQAATSIVLQLVTAAVQIWLLLDGHGVVTIVAVGVASTSIGILVDAWVVQRLMPGLLSIPITFHRRTWNRVRRFALWSSADDLIAEAGSYIDDLLLVVLLPFALLTPYSIATTVTMTLHLAAQPITGTFYPLASRLQASRMRDSLARLVLRGTQAVTAAAAPLGIIAAFFGMDIVTIWVPTATEGTSPALFAALAGGAFISVYLWTGWIVLAATGGIRTVVRLLVVEIVVEIALILLLVPDFGLLGLALADLGANAAVGLLFELPRVARLIRLPTLTFLSKSLGRLAAPILVTVIAAWLLHSAGLGNTLPELLLVCLMIGTIFLCTLLLGSSAVERAEFGELWRAVRDPDQAYMGSVAVEPGGTT